MSIKRGFLFALWVAFATTSETPSKQQLLDWTLIPAQDHSVDALRFEHLQPSHSINLFLTTKEDPNAFASADIQQLFSTVVLEHSAYLQHVSCQSDTIELTFDSGEALEIAQKWPSTGLVLITNHDSCNPVDERGLYLVTGSWKQVDTLQMSARVTKTTWRDVTDTMDVDYGVARRDGDIRSHRSDSSGPRRRTKTCSVVPVSRPERNAICGGKGILLRPQIIRRFSGKGTHLTCARECLKDRACASFSYNKWSGYCLTFKKSIKSQQYLPLRAGLLFYDRQCWQTRGDCSTTPTTTRCTSTSSTVSRTLTISTTAIPSASISTRSSSSTPTYNSQSSSVVPSPSLSSQTSTQGQSSSSTSYSTPGSYSASSSPSSSAIVNQSTSSSPPTSTTSSSSSPSPSTSTSPGVDSSSPSPATPTQSLASSSEDPETQSTSSTPTTVDTSSTSSESSPPLETLNVPELYLFSLFHDRVRYTPEGNYLLDLGNNSQLAPLVEIDPFQPDNATYQDELKGLITDCELPGYEDLSSQVSSALAAASTPYNDIPSNVHESFPSSYQVIAATPGGTRRSIESPSGVELVLYEGQVDKHISPRKGPSWGGLIFDFFFGQIVDEFISNVIRSVCNECADVWDWYKEVTDPLYIVGQICPACRPALQFINDIRDPFGYGKEVLKWFFKYGSYPPGGSPVPPPVPEPPPPVDASQCLSTTFDMILPSGTNLQSGPGFFECQDCAVSVTKLNLCGHVSISVRQNRVLKAEFVLDMSMKSKMDVALKMNTGYRFKGSTGFGSQYKGAVNTFGVFRFDIAYTHMMSWDLSSNKQIDVTFGVSSEFTNGHAKVDLASGVLSDFSNWNSDYNIKYPDVAYGTALSGFVGTQGVLNLNVDIMGNKYSKVNVFNTQNTFGLEIGGNYNCYPSVTVDSMVQGNVKIRGATAYSFNGGGRRCLQFPQASATPTPTGPFCAGLAPGTYTMGDFTYNVVCNAGMQGSMSPLYTSKDVTSFRDCLAYCNARDDCITASWFNLSQRDKCILLISNSGNTQDSFSSYRAYAQKISGPGFPKATPTPTPVVTPTEISTSSIPTWTGTRRPLIHTTYFPFVDPFPAATGVPSPPRNPDGYCGGLADGNYTIAEGTEYSITYDVQCGTMMDYTDILLATFGGVNAGSFEQCMYVCRALSTDCEAIMWGDLTGDPCVILTSKGSQRYAAAGEALAIRIGWGEAYNSVYG